MLTPKLDPNCNCICHHQEGIVHFAPCCRETDHRDAEIARLTAERDQALAQIAAVIENAAEEAGDWFYNPEDGVDESYAEEAIRALTPTDAQEALDKMLAKAREDAIREAAHLIECDGDALGGKSGAAKAIRALLNDGGRDE